jgi:predicted metallo-beta-lactamase superfamily hydrolase
MFEGKTVYAKDNRENINPSQRRRGFFFEKDLRDVAKEIVWADGATRQFGNTQVTYSKPLPHGPDPSPMGFVILTMVDYKGSRILFAPDVQGPMSIVALDYILGAKANLVIIGGPPTYIGSIRQDDLLFAQDSLKRIVGQCPIVTVDHHLSRSETASEWLIPIKKVAKETGSMLLSMAELAGCEPNYLEAERRTLYQQEPPTEEFIRWTEGKDEAKSARKPPFEESLHN